MGHSSSRPADSSDEGGSSSSGSGSESESDAGGYASGADNQGSCWTWCSSSRHEDSIFVRSSTLKVRARHSNHQSKALLVDNSGKQLHDYYEARLDNVIGEGGYATVCPGKERARGVMRAVKCIKKNMVASKERLQQEIQIMNMMDHPNIVKLYEVFEDKRCIYLVQELCRGGELFERIHEEGHFSERDAAILMQQILRALAYMHANGVCHRDLKPENFLFLHKAPIEGNVLKTIDFGIAGTFDPGTDPFTDRTGTPYYVAPEVLPYAPMKTYGKQCDIWSCGVIMYVLLSGKLPFRGSNDTEVFSKVRRGKFSFPVEVFGSVSEDAKRLITRMLTLSPSKRCTAQEALNDVWTRDFAPSAVAAPLQSSVVESIRRFHLEHKLKKSALHIVARHLEESQIRQLKNIFIGLDKNGDGHLTAQELSQGLQQAQLSHFLPEDLTSLVARLDTDGSGEIDYTEFLAATLERKQYENEDVCRAAFRVFDLNDDGKISHEELKSVLSQQDVVSALGNAEVKRLMSEVDANGDGFIDFDEFMLMMKQERQPVR